MFNQALIGALRRTKTHISSKLETVVSLAISASVNAYRFGLLKIRLGPIRLVSSQPKKPQGPVTLLEATHLACSHSLSRSRVGLRGPRALGHVFGKRFVVNRYEEYVRCDVLEHNLVFLCLNEWVSSHNVN